MRFITHEALLSLIILLLQCFEASALSCANTLVLSHVIFRHGDRTPSEAGLWPSNPYYNENNYDPYGYSQLTNEGKMREYRLGTNLRQRYSELLNETWNVKVYEAWSTDYDRTKMSLQLLLGGLFPPDEQVKWNENILWQPIPYKYSPIEQDKELSSWACPTTVPLIYADASNMARLQSYDGLIKTLQENTGKDVDYITALDLYFGMRIQEELGFPLENWTKAIYPEPLKTYTVDFYYIETSTKELKTVIAGYILKKIVSDTLNKINGNLNPPERKIFLYSGHEVNVATILTALQLYKLTDPPPYASYLSFEIHKLNGVYGVMMYYEDYTGKQPHLLTLPGCKTFCPIDNFLTLVTDIMPKSDAECYG
ncbi:venom acid phosphatase Acph-1-like [Euwallacea fornicatus]|uniref:venom acid phosphatase Acph-1-like n=1 Tax=Euwallacea fornicatus TaxID=995702 RepID=UPI00338F30BD